MKLTMIAWGLVLSCGCAVAETETERFDDDDHPAPNEGSGATGSSGAGGDPGGSGPSTSASAAEAASSTSAVTTGGGSSCIDSGAEPNDSEADAVDLGLVSDCDDDTTFEGVLDGSDEDWFVYQGSDDLGCLVDAYREAWSEATAPRVCQFVECDGVILTCPSNTTPDTSPEGRQGCCSTEPFSLTIDCNGISDDATVYIRIDDPAGASCSAYGLYYHY